MSETFRLIYVSTAAAGLTVESVADILARSVQSNRRNAITGMLLFEGNQFWECLEGAEAEVMATYHRIKRDARHFDLQLLSTGTDTKRKFPKFALGFTSLHELPTAADGQVVQHKAIGAAFRGVKAASSKLVEDFGDGGPLERFVSGTRKTLH